MPAARGVELAVTVTGVGGDPLVLVPGLGASRAVFDPLLPLLSRRRRVVVFDPRGVGASGFSEGPYTMELLAADAAAVIAGAAGGHADVLGASMGGMVAQRLALAEPARVARLILACTSPGGRHAVAPDPAADRALMGRGARTPEAAYRTACTVLYSPAFQREHPEVIAEQVRARAGRPVRPRVFAAQQHAVRGHDTWDELPGIRLPVLVLHGTEDAVVPLANGELLAERIPGAVHHWFSGLGHLFFHEDPQAAAAQVESFLGR